jgi:thiamine pyrophosphate-dependent acetolactate synthase large subunit-like protein
LFIVVIVSNNAGWGDVRHEQDAFFGPDRHVASNLSPARYDRLAEALGAAGEHVEQLAEVRPALQRAVERGGCTVIDAATDPTVLAELLRVMGSAGLM